MDDGAFQTPLLRAMNKTANAVNGFLFGILMKLDTDDRMVEEATIQLRPDIDKLLKSFERQEREVKRMRKRFLRLVRKSDQIKEQREAERRKFLAQEYRREIDSYKQQVLEVVIQRGVIDLQQLSDTLSQDYHAGKRVQPTRGKHPNFSYFALDGFGCIDPPAFSTAIDELIADNRIKFAGAFQPPILAAHDDDRWFEFLKSKMLGATNGK